MDKIWDRNSSLSEVIGHCGGDEKNRMTTQKRQKSNAKKINIKTKASMIAHYRVLSSFVTRWASVLL